LICSNQLEQLLRSVVIQKSDRTKEEKFWIKPFNAYYPPLRDHNAMDKSPQDIDIWYKKIEMTGVEIKGLDPDMDVGRLKLKTGFMNQHFINELDKIGLQLISIRGTFGGKLMVLLEAKVP
jgi:hypothetical protein